MYAHYLHKTLLASVTRPAARFFTQDTSQYYGRQASMMLLKNAGKVLMPKGVLPEKALKQIASMHHLSAKTWRLFWTSHWFYESCLHENLITKLVHR